MGDLAYSRDKYEHLRVLLEGAGEGKRKEVSENLVEFLRSAPRRLRQLEILHSLGMLQQLRSCAKALRESAEKVGAKQLSSGCEELERIPGCSEQTYEKVEAVSREYLSIERSLRRICHDMHVEV